MISLHRNALPLLLGLFLVVIVPFAFRSATASYFVGDDWLYMFKGPQMGVWAWFDLTQVTIRPYNYAYFTLLTDKLGLGPIAYDIFAWSLHVVNCLLLYSVFLRITKRQQIALMGTVIYSVGVCHITSIYWMSAIAQLFLTFFGLIGFLLHMHGGRLATFSSVIFVLLAVFAREQAVALPLVYVSWTLYDRFLRTNGLGESLKTAAIRILPYLPVVIAVLYVKLFLTPADGAGPYRIEFGPHIITNAARYIFWSIQPIAEPLLTAVNPSIKDSVKSSKIAIALIGAIVGLVGLALTFFHLRNAGQLARARFLLVSIWYVAALLPVIFIAGNVVPYYLETSYQAFSLAVALLITAFAKAVFTDSRSQGIVAALLTGFWVISSIWTINHLSKDQVTIQRSKWVKPVTQSLRHYGRSAETNTIFILDNLPDGGVLAFYGEYGLRMATGRNDLSVVDGQYVNETGDGMLYIQHAEVSPGVFSKELVWLDKARIVRVDCHDGGWHVTQGSDRLGY